MIKYTDFKSTLEKTVNDFQPIFFAFSNEQFAEGIKKLGASKDNKIVAVGMGGYILAKDIKRFISMVGTRKQRLKEYLKDPEQLKDAFIYELGNHEFCITYDYEPTLEALGLKIDKLTKRKRAILVIAKNEYLSYYDGDQLKEEVA